MIKFEKDTNVFHLANNEISYVVCLNGFGRLETLYFGPRLKDTRDILQGRSVDKRLSYFDKKLSLRTETPSEFLPMGPRECSSHGSSDYREAPIILRHENGSYLTDFEVVKTKIYRGIKPVEGMPCLDAPLKREEPTYGEGSADTVEFVMKDITANVFVHEYLSIYRDFNVIAKSFKIVNKGKKVHLLRALSLQLDLPSGSYCLHHFPGFWGRERMEEVVTPIQEGTFQIGSNFGKSSHEENPFCFLSKSENGQGKGEVIGFNLIYSGNWMMKVSRVYDSSIHVVYGINDEDFDFVLGKGESFSTPQAILSYSNHGVDAMSQAFHRLIEDHLETDPRKEDRPLLFNSWEGTLFSFTTESILSYVDVAKKLGIGCFVLDDGWFGRRNDDSSSLGDWTVNEEKIDLRKVIDYVHQSGIRFGLWFEPEMVSPESDLFQEHPEMALGYKESKDFSTLWRNQLALDFSSDQVVDLIYERMAKILSEYPIDYVKWDHNRDIAEHLSSFLPPERQGEVMHRLVLGYYRLFFRLREAFPSVMFEGCSAGGGRFDCGTLYFCPQIWASDQTNAATRIRIQYYTSLGYPLSAISSHVSAAPGSSYRTKVDVALFGTYGYEMDPTKLSEEELKELRHGSEIYQAFHQNAIQNGVCYHLNPPTSREYTALLSVSKDKTRAVAILYGNAHLPFVRFRLHFPGLDPKKRYIINYDGESLPESASGEFLEKIGFGLPEWELCQNEARLFLIKEAKY